MKNKLTHENPIDTNILLGISEYAIDYIPQLVPQSFCTFRELHTFPILLNNLLANLYNRFIISLGNLDKVENMEIQLAINKEMKIDDELSVRLKEDGIIEIMEENGE